MNVIYVCKVSAYQASGNQIDIPKKVAIDFFNVPLANIEASENIGINICHISDLKKFEIIEIQPATNPRWSIKLNKFLEDKGDKLNDGDLLVFEKLGRSFCVRTIPNGDKKHDALIDLFEKEEKHMLLSSNINIRPEDIKKIQPDILRYFTAMRTKPFLLLAGISGTGKSRIVKKMAFDSCPASPLRDDSTSPGNYKLIEVKPNWHDSSELLGYESQINGAHYVVTPFIQFLVKAMKYKDVPFFVCMDEMNLAPVEQYFAEYLSVLESRTLEEGEITSEAFIPASIFKKYEDTLKKEIFGRKVENSNMNSLFPNATQDAPTEYSCSEEEKIYELLKEKGLRLPSNLIVIGTVNMDETTHQFSRKVIDRAMTIEMNIDDSEKPFEEFFKGESELRYLEEPISLDVFKPSVVSASEALKELAENKVDVDIIKKQVPTLLNELNKALNGTPFKIAYRVQNELVVYIYNLYLQDSKKTIENLISTSIDEILMLKVLPRIEGDEDMLELPLKELAKFVSPYEKSKKKVEEMQERLTRAHFTSFWP